MQNVTVIKQDGTRVEIPIANLDNTLRILGDQVKKVDYGTVKVTPSAPKAKKKAKAKATKKKK